MPCVCWAQVFFCVTHIDVFTSKYFILQWISMNRNSTWSCKWIICKRITEHTCWRVGLLLTHHSFAGVMIPCLKSRYLENRTLFFLKIKKKSLIACDMFYLLHCLAKVTFNLQVIGVVAKKLYRVPHIFWNVMPYMSFELAYVRNHSMPTKITFQLKISGLHCGNDFILQ